MAQIGERVMVFGLLDRGSDTTAGVTKPSVTLSFGGGGGGALGGLAPDIGPFSSEAGLEEGILSLEISRGFAPGVDYAELRLMPPAGSGLLPSLGDTGSVSLAVGDRSATFTCQIDQVEHRSDGSIRMGLGNGGRILAQARLAKSFAEMTTGDVISALCSEVGVQTSDISGGENMPRYVVENTKPLLDHIARLAASMGRLARFDEAGKLELVDDASAGEEIVLSAGDAILDSHLAERAASGAMRITGAGANDWAWLRKDGSPLQADAGAAPPSRDSAAPWLRGAGGAQTLADARGRALGRAAGTGRLLLADYPDAVPGRIVTLSDSAMDGDWRVMSTTTRFDAQAGFSHEAHIAREAEGAGALGLGGLF